MADKDNKFKNEQTTLQQSAQNSKDAQVYLTWQTLIHILLKKRTKIDSWEQTRPLLFFFYSNKVQRTFFNSATRGRKWKCTCPVSKRRYIIAPKLIPNNVCLRKQSSSTAYLSYCAILCCFLTTLNSLTDRWCIFRQNILLSSLWFVFSPQIVDWWSDFLIPDPHPINWVYIYSLVSIKNHFFVI